MLILILFLTLFRSLSCTVKKREIKFSSYIRKFGRDRLQSHIWLTASPYIVKYLRISSYIRKPFLIYDFATDPIWISIYCRWGKFSFLFVSVPSLIHLALILLFHNFSSPNFLPPLASPLTKIVNFLLFCFPFLRHFQPWKCSCCCLLLRSLFIILCQCSSLFPSFMSSLLSPSPLLYCRVPYRVLLLLCRSSFLSPLLF